MQHWENAVGGRHTVWHGIIKMTAVGVDNEETSPVVVRSWVVTLEGGKRRKAIIEEIEVLFRT